MSDTDMLTGWIGCTAVDRDGDEIGEVSGLYADEETDEVTWMAISTGLFGRKTSLVPVAGAAPDGDKVQVPYEKAVIKEAPNVDPDEMLEPEEEDRLYRHYGLEMGNGAGDDAAAAAGEMGGPGHDTSGPSTDSAMTRSEEELVVGTERREAGRARLRKWVDTERVSETVAVRHDEVRIEREPITDGNVGAANDGPELSEEVHEVVLEEERAVADKRVVPKERVRLDTETVVEEEQVAADLQAERIDVEGDTPGQGR